MVDPRRIYKLNDHPEKSGCVVCWMQRDQRTTDNWMLLFAQERALALQRPMVVLFCLSPGFLGAALRQYEFMLRGLEKVAKNLAACNIRFVLLHGEPSAQIPGFLEKTGAGLLVTDFNPLKVSVKWKQEVLKKISIAFYEVDAHNILPCRYISDKPEYAAFTLRKKVEHSLQDFLTDIPQIKVHPDFNDDLGLCSLYVTENQVNSGMIFTLTHHSPDQPSQLYSPIDWAGLLSTFSCNREVTAIDWILPGEKHAAEALRLFIDDRLDHYETNRNLPEKKGQSDLSPYLHFGHLSAQRVALEVLHAHKKPESRAAFLEELIVRRELADNFCLYNQDYDKFDGFQRWARHTLNKHRNDHREFLYSVDQFEKAETHDNLWNAAQREMVCKGKMHGFMRMYWAKKILEWTTTPEEAVAIAIYLNDKYLLDGRDPNGYAGIAWAIGGTHDRPWGERNIFGMIRFMNYQGCKRKFDINSYIKQNNQ